MKKAIIASTIAGLIIAFTTACGVTEANTPITEPNTITIAEEVNESIQTVLDEVQAIEIPEAPVEAVEEVVEPPVEEVAPIAPQVPQNAVYNVYVGTYGHQAEIDACVGPVLSDYGSYGISIGQHNDCGGDYVLGINPGDTIILTGVINGTYVATGSMDVLQNGTDASVLGGGLYLQTCYWDNVTMRLVHLEQV